MVLHGYGAASVDAQQPGLQLSSQDPVEQARQLFAEGLSAVEREDWVVAEDRFRRVLALRSSHVASYNLASALVHLGRLLEGSEQLRAIVHDPVAEAATRDAATQLLSEVEPRIGSLTIRVGGTLDGARLSLDGRSIELTGQALTLSVDPGKHEVSLQRREAPTETKAVVVGGDAPLQAEVTFELAAPLAPAKVAQSAYVPTSAGQPRPIPRTAPQRKDEPEPQDDGSILSEWWLWTGLAVLAAGAAATVIVVSSPGEPDPVRGDTLPPVIRGRVVAP
jgi:hypothetical protein